MPAEKYKLHKVEPGGSKPRCAFFFSDKGCRNGGSCKFSHEAADETTKTSTSPAMNSKKCKPVISSSDSVCSSESELDMPINKLPAKNSNKNQKKKDKQQQVTPKKDEKMEEDPCPFRSLETTPSKKNKKRKKETTSPKTTSQTPPQQQQQDPPNNIKKQNKKNTNPQKTVDTTKPTPPPQTTSPKSKKRKTDNTPKSKTPPKSTTPSFRDLKLPISTFSCYNEKEDDEIEDTTSPTPQAENKQKKKKQKMQKKDSDVTDDASSSEEEGEIVAKKAVPPPPTYPIPHSTEEGLKWQKAVTASQANSRFSNAFDFDKYKKKDEERKTGYPADWVKAKKFGDWCKGNPHAIAIDCEMCKTCDPVTGAEDHKALCRLSVVNACDTSDVLIDTLVKPAWPVTDYRSWVNGIKKDDLQSVQFTLRHAQAFMLALCSEETVIIGHSVENDLVALKMEHYTVADSAFLFNVKDEERNSTPSLKDCAYHILKRDMPDTHDSVNDARVSLMCIEEGWIQKKNKGEDIDDIPRTFSKKKRTGSRKRDDGGNSNSQEYAHLLFVHRIPTSLSEEHISNLFVHMTSVQPKDVPDIDFGADYGKTTVAFSSEVHAKLAFESLKGDAKPDKTGRLQKRIYLKKGGYVQVRKMVNQ